MGVNWNAIRYAITMDLWIIDMAKWGSTSTWTEVDDVKLGSIEYSPHISTGLYQYWGG